MIKEYSKGFAAVFFALSLVVHAHGAHIPATPAMASKAARNCNNLGIYLYLILSSGDNNNVVFSPIGLTKAMGTATESVAQAQKKVLEEMNEVLEFNSKTFFDDMKRLSQEITDKRNDGVQVKFESILLGKDDIERLDRSMNHKPHLQETHLINPKGENSSASKSLKVHEVARDLGNLDYPNPMNLVNKAVFKAHWEIPFSVFKRSSFHIPGRKGFPDKKVQVDFMGFMSDENQMNYFDDEQYRCQIIELNYGNNFIGDSWDPRYSPADVSMVIVLPYEDQPLMTLEERLSPGTTERWFSKLKLTYIDVSIPKFNISTLLDATVSLQELGIHSLFTKPDSGISVNPLREGKLHSLWQEASIAASQTGTGNPRMPSEDVSIMLIPNPKKTFEAVRPFLFFIREKTTNVILFMGRVVDPNQS